MSRISDYDPYDIAGFLRSCAFSHNIDQALAGKKGKAFLKELEEALLALPEKRLAYGSLAETEDEDNLPPGTVPEPTGEVCALGAVYLMRAAKKGVSKEEALKEMVRKFDPSESDWELQKQTARELKISHPLAYIVIYQNDESPTRNPEERYQMVLKWVREELAKKQG
jgi:hypothetical protein